MRWCMPLKSRSATCTSPRLPNTWKRCKVAGMPLRVIIPGEEEGQSHVGGVHNRPPIPDGSAKAECPKFMSHGPCGGVRKGGYCEVYPEMMCPWVTLYFELEKIGQLDWMKQV
ncbi:MAG: methylenetetrahydrofolate reductase C-terminal domain-containing protein [Nitrospirae bacterium]|nr:methylenetetrahydrofolate reductase C-terminal domain-containing protein [Nitrospirota bacterium]